MNAESRTGIHSGVIKNSDVPDKLLEYTRQFNVSLECIWNITVMPGWKVSCLFLLFWLGLIIMIRMIGISISLIRED